VRRRTHHVTTNAAGVREYVIPDDVKALAVPTLAHRIIIGPGARVRDVTSEAIVRDVLNRVAVPGAGIGQAPR
jgi:MoxR-like ATPase